MVTVNNVDRYVIKIYHFISALENYQNSSETYETLTDLSFYVLLCQISLKYIQYSCGNQTKTQKILRHSR